MNFPHPRHCLFSHTSTPASWPMYICKGFRTRFSFDAASMSLISEVINPMKRHVWSEALPLTDQTVKTTAQQMILSWLVRVPLQSITNRPIINQRLPCFSLCVSVTLLYYGLRVLMPDYIARFLLEMTRVLFCQIHKLRLFSFSWRSRLDSRIGSVHGWSPHHGQSFVLFLRGRHWIHHIRQFLTRYHYTVWSTPSYGPIPLVVSSYFRTSMFWRLAGSCTDAIIK